jgi:hypothetical protein
MNFFILVTGYNCAPLVKPCYDSIIQSPEQKEFQKNVERWNYQYSVCRSLDEFMKCISDYIFDI